MSHHHSSYLHKPENALRRALELQSISQPDAALSLLHDILSSRRHKTWSPSYEQVMLLYLDLCLKKNKSREAKDGLHQYRNLSQSQAPGSLEIVIRYLIEKAEMKCKMAKESVEDMASGDSGGGELEDDDVVDDLVTHRSILLSTMSLDPEKTQRETAVVLPSLKFLWETYRAVLDILRSNSKLEHLYHSAALGALEFCKVYKRKTEFRRLCDMLRQHLGNLQKYGGGEGEGTSGKMNSKVRGWEGWTNEAIELHLQTRFSQLSTASHLHLYTEGFRTVEDIYNILQISHAPSSRRLRQFGQILTAPKAKVMATYYEKLTTLFWVSENHLFHAFAWYKYYTLCREYNRTMSEETRRLLASTVLISALCIPETLSGSSDSAEDDDALQKEKRTRMATLLGFHTKHPTRAALLFELKQKGVIDDVPGYLSELYGLLERKSDALVLVKKASPLLLLMKNEANELADSDDKERYYPLAKYIGPLTNILLLKLLLNLSQAYYTVSLPFLKKLTSNDTLDLTFQQVEKSIVQLTSTPHVAPFSVKIDHRTQSLRFTNMGRWDDKGMSTQLTVLSKSLHQLNLKKEMVEAVRLRPRGPLFEQIRSSLPSEHASVLERKNTIEKRKEEVERLAQEKLQRSLKLKAQEEAQRKKEEKARLARESRLREKERLLKIQTEMETNEKKKYLKAMGKDVEAMKAEELEKVDAAKLAKEHQSKLNKKDEERKRKMNEKQKKLDYVTRATRIEELPLVKANFTQKILNDKKRWEVDVVEKAKNAKTLWENDCQDKLTLQKFNVFDHLADFQQGLQHRQQAIHQKLCEDADKQAKLEAIANKKRRALQRKKDHQRKLKEDEQKRKEEEEFKKQEEERLRREEDRKKKKLEEEKRRKEEVKRMEEERERREREKEEERGRMMISRGERPLDSDKKSDLRASANAGAAAGKYMPPAMRKKMMEGGAGGGSQRFSRMGSDRGEGFAGGRYDNNDRSDRFSHRGGGFGGERYMGGDRDGARDGGRFSDRDRDRDRQGSQRFSDARGGGRRDHDRPEPRNSRWT